MYSKYPGLDMFQRIHIRCESIIAFKSIIRFWILLKKRTLKFEINQLQYKTMYVVLKESTQDNKKSSVAVVRARN